MKIIKDFNDLSLIQDDTLAPPLLITIATRFIMKKAILISLMFLSSVSQAWVEKNPQVKEYVFKYKLSGESLEIKRSAQSYEDAFKVAAQQCFTYYKGAGKVSEDRGLDIIDVCANPRS